MPTITVTVSGQPAVLADISRRSGPQLAATLRKATRAGATASKPYLVAAAPVRTGATRRSITVRATRERIGASVGPRIWYRHFPIVGTSRGVKPNPWVERGGRAGSVAARLAMEAVTKVDIQR